MACGTCVRRPLKPRSDCIRLCRSIRSVTTGTRWSGPMKSRIVYELLPSRTTEYYGGSGPFRLKILTNKQTNKQTNKHSNYSRHVCPSGQAATNVGVRGLSPVRSGQCSPPTRDSYFRSGWWEPVVFCFCFCCCFSSFFF